MKKMIFSIILLVAALTLVAQPVLASVSPANQVNAVLLNAPSGGVTKLVSCWYGYKVYLSNSLCIQMGAVLSTGGLGALALWVGSTGWFAAPIWAVILGVGVTLISFNAKCQKGVIVTVYRIPWPGFPYGLLIPGPITCQ